MSLRNLKRHPGITPEPDGISRLQAISNQVSDGALFVLDTKQNTVDSTIIKIPKDLSENATPQSFHPLP
jgi:hypothetical protein